MSDFLSIRYIFNHYFDEPSVVRLLLEHNIILSFANNRRILIPILFTGSLRQQYGKELAEPITRCLNAFSNNEGITRYFITLLGILANEQRTSFATASPIAAQITAVLQHADLLAVFVAAARQWSDGYTRLLFLFLCTLFATGRHKPSSFIIDPSSHSLLVQNSAVFLPSLADATPFSPKNSRLLERPRQPRRPHRLRHHLERLHRAQVQSRPRSLHALHALSPGFAPPPPLTPSHGGIPPHGHTPHRRRDRRASRAAAPADARRKSAGFLSRGRRVLQEPVGGRDGAW